MSIPSQYIGLAAGIGTGISMLPQLFKIIKEKDADGISAGMLVVLMCGLALWVWYGVLKQDLPIIITNAFSFLVNATILALMLVYRNKR